jgi:hypothetical protein
VAQAGAGQGSGHPARPPVASRPAAALGYGAVGSAMAAAPQHPIHPIMITAECLLPPRTSVVRGSFGIGNKVFPVTIRGPNDRTPRLAIEATAPALPAAADLEVSATFARTGMTGLAGLDARSPCYSNNPPAEPGAFRR